MCHKKGWICGACTERFVDRTLYPCDLAANNVFPNRHCKKHWWVIWEPKDPKKTDDENEEKNRGKRCPGCEPRKVSSAHDVLIEQGVQHSSDAGKQQYDEQSSTVTDQHIEAGDRAIAAATTEGVQFDHAAGYSPRDPIDAAEQVEETAQAASVEPGPVDLDSSRRGQVAEEEHLVRAESEDSAGADARTAAQTVELPASLDYDEQFPPLPSMSLALGGGTDATHTDPVAITEEHSSLDRNDNGLALPQVNVPSAATALAGTEQDDRVASGFAEPGPQNRHAVEQSKDDEDLLDSEYDIISPGEAEVDTGPDGDRDDEDDDWELLNGEDEDEDDEGHGVVDDYGIPLHKQLPPRPDEA